MDFVIQEHEAERAGLHYDLRLDVGNTLESWVVPKGVPLVTGQRRLAVKVTDHSIGCKGFEGTIKEGYGKGDVRIWDEGEYEFIDGNPTSRYIKFMGDKVRGNYILRKWKDNKWLIWKR